MNEEQAEPHPDDASSPDPSTAWLAEAAVDLDRHRRCGFPEVIYGPGKTPQTVVEIARKLVDAGQDLLATRLDSQQQSQLNAAFPDGVANARAGTFRRQRDESPLPNAGRVIVVTAGTSDLPVAEEAVETLRWMRASVQLITDVGVAGPQRLLAQAARLREADVVVVVAGMEGALPSVVGGHVNCPIIAVPTSVGYGANLQGVAALLSMLNSCAANVAVVNIDAGFKGGYMAGLIGREKKGHGG